MLDFEDWLWDLFFPEEWNKWQRKRYEAEIAARRARYEQQKEREEEARIARGIQLQKECEK